MRKKIILSFILISVLMINLVSAYYYDYHDSYDEDGWKKYEGQWWTENGFDHSFVKREKVDYDWDDFKIKRKITEWGDKKPAYSYRYYPNYENEYNADYSKHIDYSSWRYKPVYHFYDNYYNDDYYYKPRYDSQKDVYNWKW